MKRLEIAQTVTDEADIPRMLAWAESMARKGLQRGAVVCRLGRPRRTLDQNKKLWPMCTDIAKQVEWYGQKLSKEDWKDVFVGSLKGQRPIPGIPMDGVTAPLVMVGGGSSRLSVREFCDLIEFIYSFGNDRGVIWSDPSKDTFAWLEERRAA